MTGQYTDFFFPEHGVRYVAVNDCYDSDKEDNDIAPFKHILYEMYAKDISKKVRSMRATSAKQGKFMGSKPPYGYVKSSDDKHQLIPDPYAAEIVKRLFREFACGASGRSIATNLNSEGVDTPAVYYFKQTGKRSTRGDSCPQWGSATIMQLLKNHVYIGNMVQCKRKVSSFKTKKRITTSSDDWVTVEATHEPLVDSRTWENVQRRFEKTKKAPCNNAIRGNGFEDMNIFSGIIECADCGAAMQFNHKIRKGVDAKNIYRCGRYVNNGKDACSTHSIDAELLAYVILKDIQRHAETAVQDESQLLSRLLFFSENERRNEKVVQERVLRDTTNRMAFVENASKKLFEERITGNVPDSLFKKMLTDYERELSSLEEKATGAKRSILEIENNEPNCKASN